MREVFKAGDYEATVSLGEPVIREFQALDKKRSQPKDLVTAIYPIVADVGQALERLDRPEEAAELYWWIVSRGCANAFPFRRCVILFDRSGQYDRAILASDAAINNDWFDYETQYQARKEFPERLARSEKKKQKQELEEAKRQAREE